MTPAWLAAIAGAFLLGVLVGAHVTVQALAVVPWR